MTDSTSLDPLYLCLDQGGHASRALVFDCRGRLVQQARRPLLPEQPAVDRVEYSALALLDSLRESVVEVIAGLGERSHLLVAAGLATQRSNIVCWDKQTGDPLSPILSWQDRRHAQWLEQFSAQATQIHQLTGLALSPHYGASKLRWCLDNLPAVQQARDTGRLLFGPMAAWLIQQLTGSEARADPVNASRTQLWSLKDRDWNDQLLALFGIPRELLPACSPSLVNFGTLADAPNLPLQMVTGDQSAALYAYGPLRTDTAYINLGTGAFVSRPAGNGPPFDSQLLSSVVLQTAERTEHVLEGTVNGAGAALDWLARQHGLEQLAPKQIEGWLGQDYSHLPLFLNGVSGLAAPYWRADFESRFIGQGELAQQAVAVLESILFLLQTNLTRMKARLGTLERIQITGGLAHLDDLCQRLADLAGIPVYRPAECEATARGSAYLLAGQPDDWPEPGPTDQFEPRAHPDLSQRYDHWQRAMREALGQS
ncbi:MAG: FGGY family carbohydrate kinase [Thiohalophilus sp.]|jgi:glycerol kinase